VWAILERFGNKKVFDELNHDGSGIHRLENVLTLNHDVHYFFDTFRLWLEPVETVSNPPLLTLLPVPIGALSGFSGHTTTKHIQTLCGSTFLYQLALETHCNIHYPGSLETSPSITILFGASCCMLQGC
jgi:hypothetical protein